MAQSTTKERKKRKRRKSNQAQVKSEVESRAEAQENTSGIGYLCICGFKTLDKQEFTSHVMFKSREEGKGTHLSAGRVNMESGEVVAPPWRERSASQRENTPTLGKAPGGDGTGEKKDATTLAEASQIKLVPRTYVMDYSPIMRMAQDAAVQYFGWREDMPLVNFIDTVLYMFFKEKGITLLGYIVDESVLNKEEQHGHRT